ncbi:MAG: accessory gene regulator B family protein [Bacillota bacterium]|nr:accessory gene regulator B family protein [Bacillota bacterium]
MVEKLAAKLCEGIDDEIVQAKVLYGLRIFFSEASKFTLLLLTFILLHKTRYYFFSLVIFCTIRVLTGGIHLDTSIKCFLLSDAFFLAAVFSTYIPRVETYVYVTLGFISLCIVVIKAPIPSKNRPLNNTHQRKILKIGSIIVTLLWLIFLLTYIKNTSLLNCGIITIFLLSLQLINKKRRLNNVIFITKIKD